MKLVKVGVLAATVLAVAAFAGIGLPQGAKGGNAETLHGITVTGTGEAKSVPDRAGFTFGVETRRKTAAEALAANSVQMRGLIEALKNARIPERDIQTTAVSLWPDYRDSGSDRVGYVAANSVSVTVSVSGAGNVVDAAVDAGADQVDGPSLTKVDTAALERAALRAAVADARQRAEALAGAAGVELGAVISVQEQGEPGPLLYSSATTTAARESVPVEPGTQRVETSVSVTFAIA
jgi:uncharacterized protein